MICKDRIIIFNGLSQNRYELTKYLNLKKNKKIILVECKSEKYDEEFSINLYSSESKEENLQIENAIMEKCQIKLRKDYDGLYYMMDRVCLSCASVIFKNKVFSSTKEKYNINQLMMKLNIKEQFTPFFMKFLNILQENGYLNYDNDEIAVLKSIEDIPEAKIILDNFTEEQKKFAPYVELLIYCASKYERVFSGEIPANEVIYPTGEFNMLDDVDSKMPLSTKRYIYGDVLADIINNFVSKKKKKVRILEIGAGTAELTTKILSRIKDVDNIEYCFTDIGQSFVAKAKINAEVNGYKFMNFKKLDISADIEQQGFNENSFDIIISYDVLQATNSIEKSLKNIKKMLVPGGICAQVQSYDDHDIDNLIYGLSPGWWNFTKDPIRGKGITMHPQEWQKILENVGFNNVQVLPEEIELSDAGVFLSFKPYEKNIDNNKILYNQLKNNLLKKLQSVNEECSIEFINSFDKEDIDAYMSKLSLSENDEVLYKDNPQNIRENEYIDVTNDLESKLFEILKTIFGVEDIAINDELQKLGLDSLSGLLLISKLRQEFKVELNMKDFYSFETVFDIAEYIKSVGIKDIDLQDVEIESKEESKIGSNDISDLMDLL
ncbi:class I SAM-dependent methyltransferase [Clostridium saccharoperbutylacetonicum]|uniref:class I SAM-dependent methyltransferase n=1 Tax=Clostridium saccharoperbutylacetonicum TaxID=36745 RepID=UPI0039E8185C